MASTSYSIENARILFRNFSGRVSDKNPAGNKSVNVILPSGLAEDLFNESTPENGGWNIKQFKDDPVTGEPGEYHIQLKVKYDGYKPPKIYIVTNRKKTLLTEETVSQLDYAEIENVDLTFTPSYWKNAMGNKGIAAYLDTMYVKIVEDVFASKYNFDEDDDIPFED